MANSFNLDSLNHNEVHDYLAEITKQLDSVLPKGKEEAKSFLDAVEKFDNAWDKTKDDELIALDAAADMAWVDFNAFLIGVVNYPDNNISGAAAEIKDTFDEFEDPTELPYEQEYQILANLIVKFGPFYTLLLRCLCRLRTRLRRTFITAAFLCRGGLYKNRHADKSSQKQGCEYRCQNKHLFFPGMSQKSFKA